LNLKGEMIGLTTALAAISGYEQAAGYAVPIDDTFRRVVETLKQGREVEYGFLGVAPKSLRDADLAAGRRGVVVHDVVEGTPAKRFGLEAGDIITHVDERPIFRCRWIGAASRQESTRCRGSPLGRAQRPHDSINVQLTKYPMRGRQVISTPAPNGVVCGRLCQHRPRFPGRSPHAPNSERRLRGRFLGRREQPGLAGRAAPGKGDYPTSMGFESVSPKEFHAAVAGKAGPVTLRLVSADKDQTIWSSRPRRPPRLPRPRRRLLASRAAARIASGRLMRASLSARLLAGASSHSRRC